MKLSDMTPGQLFDLFVAHGVTTAEIAEMSGKDIQRHIGEMRAAEPDDDPITDAEIADAIRRYAADIYI